MAAALLDVNIKEELSAIKKWLKIRFFITVLQQMARADLMTALLSPAVGGSIQSQMEAKLVDMNLQSPRLKSAMPGSPSARTFTPALTRTVKSHAFDSKSSFLSPHTANPVGNLNNAAATLVQQPAKLKAVGNAAHRIFVPALASSTGERDTWAGVLGQVAERDNPPHKRYPLRPVPQGGAAPYGLDGLSPVVGDSWASVVNKPLLLMFQKTSTFNNNAAGQTVDLAAAKLNDLCGGGGNVSRLDGPDKFRRPSKGHVHNSSSGPTAVNNGVSNIGVYGDDGDLISGQGHHGPGVGRVQSNSSRGLRNGGGGTWSGGHSPTLSNTPGRFGGSDDGSNAMAVAHQQVALAGFGMGVGGFNLGLGSPGLVWMPNGLRMVQLAQLNGMNGMNPFGVNMNMLGMANLSAMGITPEAQLLVAQIAAAGGGFGHPGLGAGLGSFGELQGGIGGDGLCVGSGWSGGRLPGLSGGSGGAGGKIGGCAHSGYTSTRQTLKDDALETQGVAALGARRKMLKTFEVVRRKMGIDDPTAPPPPGPLSSGGPTPWWWAICVIATLLGDTKE
ncbi:hypothetical protein BJY52DRAFT_1200660 [Lactarius psammicola]|nr:hypothetical protein BJY52DRAFT_1200660 [Lactarius psammicola]